MCLVSISVKHKIMFVSNHAALIYDIGSARHVASVDGSLLLIYSPLANEWVGWG